MSSSVIKLAASNGAEVSVSREIANQSVLVKNLLEDVGEQDHAIPLPNVSESILKKVIEYATHHQNDPPPPSTESIRPSLEIDEWDRNFMNVEQELIFELILAANYLDMKNLLDLGCKTVANMIKGKSVEEIRKQFNIVNDFTPEEEEQIRKENEWATDA